MPSSSESTPSRRLISLPVFWQVLGLSLVVLVLALVINTVMVLWAPEPAPSGYSLGEAARALKGDTVRLRNGRQLKAVTTTQAPDFLLAGSGTLSRHDLFETRLAQRLAVEMKIPTDSLTVHMPLHRRFIANGDGPPPPQLQPGQGGDVIGFSVAGPGPGPDGPVTVAAGGGAPPPPPGGPSGPRNVIYGEFSEPGGPGLRIITDNRTDILYPPFSAAWKLKDGRYRVIDPPEALIAPWQARLLMGFGLTALLILPLAWWLSQRLSRPIVAFSDAASRIGVEDNAPPVLAIGPREVRQAAEVLNAMQARIRKQIEARTALMGAIAHDLKTPLARMRLRIEDLPSPLRDKLGDDIGHMDGLIRSAMSFTSAHKLGETLRPLDLSALVESLADDLCAVCRMEPPLIEHNIMVKGDAVALKRIVTNLVENAGRYATGCRIELAARGPEVEVRVLDNGPGLPA
ncbi:MAG: two-component sensor histidine kinase, partial [Asticcacaulis sp.]|nr:two-component sensor histidine kinase [Asticcacaulis sp.]